MTTLLRAELLKLRTTRTFLALSGVAVGTSLLIATLVASLSKPTEESVLNALVANETMVGFKGHRTPGLPRDRVVELLRDAGRIT